MEHPDICTEYRRRARRFISAICLIIQMHMQCSRVALNCVYRKLTGEQ